VRSTLIRVFVLALVVAACTAPGGSTSPSGASPIGPGPSGAAGSHALTILGAASLKAVLDEAKTAYEAANPGTTLVVAVDSSSALEAQIELGSDADVFLSADTANPQKLVGGGLAEGEAKVFAGNKLTIVIPVANPAAIESWKDLADGGLKIIAAGEAVPITKYATQLVENLAARSDAPAGFAAAYAAGIVSREENVKALIAKLELGEGDAGIVYVTDAKASVKVSTITVPDDANVPATYAGVVLKASDDLQRAEAFLDWFAGPDGQAILVRSGFLPPPQ